MEWKNLGGIIRRLRKEKDLSQRELGERIGVTDKTVSKWETGGGIPDAMLWEPLAGALGVSLGELMAGEPVVNANVSCNMKKTRFFLCPVCGNILTATGEAAISCCGMRLKALEPRTPDGSHRIRVERVEDEFFVTLDHAMTKDHFVTFIAAVQDNGCALVKLYPEGPAEARLPLGRTLRIYVCCSRDGLFAVPARVTEPEK